METNPERATLLKIWKPMHPSCFDEERSITYLCICPRGSGLRDFQRIHLCTGHNRNQLYYRCISDILLSSGCSSQLHWDQCCHCTGRGDKSLQGHSLQEDLQNSHHHTAHTFYLQKYVTDVHYKGRCFSSGSLKDICSLPLFLP